ncbi:DUF3267 domain-containing protein [Aerococcaceae bacterium NML210727]|nr:DUF3267 domain-containing protein [Aerococcaceae bacterium NML210727]MCW6653818.1 DUF3267 domain-containing protein [Aerococcaceae bacterium NML201296]
MIQFRNSIENISEYQMGMLPQGARKLDTPSTEEMLKIAMPICIVICILFSGTVFYKVYTAPKVEVLPLFIGIALGLAGGGVLLVVHEWLHAIVYPKEATVTIAKIKGKILFVALASYPLKRSRFILMCLLPFILGIIPYVLFILYEPVNMLLSGVLFGLSGMGMASPYPDVFNTLVVLKQCKKTDKIMFYGDDMYCISNDYN